MMEDQQRIKNPRRVAAGRRNRQFRRGLTLQGRARLRAAALCNQPWRWATGPRTPAGKRRSADNGRWRQRGTRSLRQIRRELREVLGLAEQLATLRRQLAGHKYREGLVNR